MNEHSPAEPGGPTPQVSSPDRADAEPMTASLLGRLFVVPAMIAAMIVACSIVVVLLFGSITAEKERSLEELIATIEQGGGQPNFFGGLWPKDKEHYHAERELLLRLRNKDREVPAEKRPELARRIAAVLETVVAHPAQEKALANERCLMQALGLLEEPAGVEVLLNSLRAGSSASASSSAMTRRRQYAAEALAMLKSVPDARAAVPELCAVVENPGEPKEVRMVAAVSVSCLAPRTDPAAVAALRTAYYSDDLELKWNAALALARLGDASARSLLQEMLHREYWERENLVEFTTDKAQTYQRKLTPVEVGGNLAATIDAAANLGLPELNELIGRLQDDPWPQVRQRAAAAVGEQAHNNKDRSSLAAEEADTRRTR